MRIDFHTHCFPDALAPRAMASLEKTFFPIMGLMPSTDGTANSSKALLQGVGIDRAVVCNIATNAKQESNVNSFAISLAEHDDFFIPLGSVHPDSMQIEEELDRLQAAGIKGIKLHPDYVGVMLLDERMDRIFTTLEARGMLCVLHTGYDPISPDLMHATPKMLREVIEKHPRLKLVAAHMGSMHCADEVLELLVGTGIYLDTSLCSLRERERETLIKILQQHDENRLLFATDTPWSDPAKEVAFIENAPISSERKEKIFYKNALALLNG